MKNIVSMRWLLARMYEPDVVIADCRFLLGQPEAEDKPMKLDIFQELSISIWKRSVFSCVCARRTSPAS